MPLSQEPGPRQTRGGRRAPDPQGKRDVLGWTYIVFMLKKSHLASAILLTLSIPATAQGPQRVAIGDWPEMRGPGRDGVSRETGLVDTWALNGENFLWRVPYGGRSAPIVMGNRVYVQNPAGRGADLQERVMALDADTGAMIWEHRFSIFQSDVPSHRVGWASPAADPETGNIYALSGGAQVIALNRDGERLWDRSFGEEFAAFTTHGGRTMSPVVDGDLVIVSGAMSNWGAKTFHFFLYCDRSSLSKTTPGIEIHGPLGHMGQVPSFGLHDWANNGHWHTSHALTVLQLNALVDPRTLRTR